MIVVAEKDRPLRIPMSASAAPMRRAEKAAVLPLKKRMNCFGYIDRDSGQRRVPEPPDKYDWVNIAHEIGSHKLTINSCSAANGLSGRSHKL